MNKQFFGLCAIALACTNGVAQEQQDDAITLQKLNEVVISDSRFELKRENSGKTVIKISAEELQRNQGKTVAEIINTKSGLELTGSRGREGAILGVYARGGRGRQVLILIDGVRVSDPSSSSSEYDLRLLSAANIESIEIIKGAASTLYGTNAATAVINITTKKASKKPISGSFKSTFGTQQTTKNQNYNLSEFSNSALVNGTLDKFMYGLGFSNRYTNGLSDIVTVADEKDPYSEISTDLKLGYQFSKKFDVQLYANQTKLRTSYDESYGLYDAPYTFESEQKRVGIASKYNYNAEGSIHLNAAYSNYDSENKSAYPSTFKGDNYTLDVYNKYSINNQFYTILGLNYIQDEAELGTDKKITITDPYANLVYVSSFGLNMNVGARLNNNSEYGSHFVYNINPSYTYKLKQGYLKFLSSYATSYITPSLTQLFGFYGANPNLEPEENSTLEGGIEYANDQLRLSALYFNRDENQPIVYGVNGYENIDGFIDAEGVEVELDWNLSKNFKWMGNYTFTERKGDNAIRIPKHKINASIDYQFSKATHASLGYAYTGDRLDTDFNTYSDISLDAFSIFNLYISHELIPQKLQLFLNADNLLNEDYVEVIGYTTRVRNLRLGLSLNL
tara:strand:- start:54 stop:1916 length:1863 start_codon:yes stop_codon:yes gene_type:complete